MKFTPCVLLVPLFLWSSQLGISTSLAQAPAAPAAPGAAAPTGPKTVPGASDVPTGPAGKLISKDGKEILWADVTMTGTSVGWKTKNPSTGADTIINIPSADIIRLDFPEPPELQSALIALSRNEVDKAVSLAKPVVEQFSPFKPTPGTWWPAASMIQLEAMAIKRDPGYDKLRGDLKTINLSSSDNALLSTVDATYDYVKGILGPALASVDKLLATADEGPVKAKLYLLRGDIQFKRGNFAEALEAYLHVPVFYGAQAAYLPNAELGAARSLQKLGRLEDAVESFRSLKERYADMPQAAEANKELNALTQALGTTKEAEPEEGAKAEPPLKDAVDAKAAAKAAPMAEGDKPKAEAEAKTEPK